MSNFLLPDPGDSEEAFSHSAQIDLLLITALEDELEAAKTVDDGAHDSWVPNRDSAGRLYFTRNYKTVTSGLLSVALASPGVKGGEQTAETAARLIGELSPRFLAMSGVCAGRKGKVGLGDLILADTVFRYDGGKRLVTLNNNGTTDERSLGEQGGFRMDHHLLETARTFAKEARSQLAVGRPPTQLAQERWVIRVLHEADTGGASPLKHKERQVFCPEWTRVLQHLRKNGMLARKGLTLTKAGRAHWEELLIQFPDGIPADPPFEIRIGPMASGQQVVEDKAIFDRLEQTERNLIGLEMEVAAIAMVAHRCGLPRIAVKGVIDYASPGRNNAFRNFAARTSAAFILAFIRQNPPPPPPPKPDSTSKKIKKYLLEYIDFIDKRLNQQRVDFKVDIDPIAKELAQVELRGQIRSLRYAVETRNVKIEFLERLVADNDKFLTLFASKSDTIQVIAQSNAAALATATSTLSLELPKLQGALDNLREEVDTPALKEAQDLADKIPPGADKEKVIESGVMPKLKHLIERGMDAETKFGKVVKSAESGIKNLKKVGKAYNAIAEWTGMPTIPRALLGGKKT